jgi:hypothetical protein
MKALLPCFYTKKCHECATCSLRPSFSPTHSLRWYLQKQLWIPNNFGLFLRDRCDFRLCVLVGGTILQGYKTEPYSVVATSLPPPQRQRLLCCSKSHPPLLPHQLAIPDFQAPQIFRHIIRRHTFILQYESFHLGVSPRGHHDL